MAKERMKAKNVVSDYLNLFEDFEKIGPNSIGKRYGPLLVCVNFLFASFNTDYAPEFYFETPCREIDRVGMTLAEDINMPNRSQGKYYISLKKHQSSVNEIYQTIISQVPLLKQENISDYLICEKIKDSIVNKKVYPMFYNYPDQAYYLLVLIHIWLDQIEFANEIYRYSLEKILSWPKSEQESMFAGEGVEAWKTFFEPMLKNRQELIDLVEANLKAWKLDHIKDHGIIKSGIKFELNF